MLSKIDVNCSLQKNNLPLLMEDMGDYKNHTKESNCQSEFANQINYCLNFFSMIRPKPAFHFVREGTAADIVSADTHVVQPLCFIS